MGLDLPSSVETVPTGTSVGGSVGTGDQSEVVPMAPLVAVAERESRASHEAAARGGARTWHTGTLVYTLAGLAILFGWLLWGDFATSVKDRGLGAVFQVMLDKFGASAKLVSWLSGSLPPALAMILGPIISYQSDRHRGPLGRRIPFLLYGTPVAALAIIGLGFCPMLGGALHRALGAHSPGLNTLVLGFLALFWVLFDLASVLSTSLFGALINDVVPANVMGRFWGAMRAVSLMAGVGFNYWLLGLTKEYYLWILVGIGTLFGVGFCMMSLNVKEGNYPPAPPALTGGAVGNFVQATKGYFVECLCKPYYLLVFFVLAVPAFALMPVNLFNIFLANSLHVGLDTLGKYTAAMYFVSFALSYPLGMLADKIHPLRLGIVALAVYCGVAFWGGTQIHDRQTFLIAFVAIGVASGCWMTGAASLGQRLLPGDKFAQYLSAAGMVNCVCQVLLGAVLGPIIDHYNKDFRISYLAGGITASSCLVAAVALYIWMKRFGGTERYVAP